MSWTWERPRIGGEAIANRSRRRVVRLGRAGLSAAALIAGWASQTQAQDLGAGGAPATDDAIIVTAQRRAQAASSLGMAISAFSGDALTEKGINTAEQLWQITPGLIVKDAGYGVPTYTLRGVGFENYFVNSSSTVGLYADEISIAYPVMSRGLLFDLERVEVLKGPQGDLYGRNTTAGQINFIDRKPTPAFAAGGQIDIGRFDAVNAEAYVSGPLTDRIQARLSGAINTSDGWQHSLSRPDDKPLGAKDEGALRGQVNFDLNPGGSLLLRSYWVRDTSDNEALTPVDGHSLGLPNAQAKSTTGEVLFSTGDNRVADWTPGFRPHRNNTTSGVAATLNQALGGVVLTSISAYDRFKRHETNDYDGAAASDSNAVNISTIDAVSQEIRLANRNKADTVNWIVGAYYSKDRVHEDYRFYMLDSFYGNVLGIKALNTRYTQNTDSVAGFGHVEVRVADGVRLVGGARLTQENQRFEGCTYDLDGSLARFVNTVLIPHVIAPLGLPVPANIPPGGCSVYDDRIASPTYGEFTDAEERARTSKWMWKGGVEYEPARDVLLYANISSGFKSGGFNGANANLKSQESAYQPEELTAYETGVKATLRPVNLYLDGSFFYYDYKDKQTNGSAVTFVGDITGITNIPKSRIYGVDATARWSPFKGASITLNATWLDSRILEWTPVSPLSVYPTVVHYDAAGQSLPNAPALSVNVTPSYQFDLGQDLNLRIVVDYLYRSSTSGAGLAYQATPAYSLVNTEVSVGPRGDRWRVTLWGKNIFDQYYYNYAGLPGNANYVRAVGQPATFGLRLAVAL